MIPTYRPSEPFLREALLGLLQQDPGVECMQIEVVDDCSPDIDVRALVERIAGKRVQFCSTMRNFGLAGCWNECVNRARGEWVHLLHQDDILYPGFYAELEKCIRAHPEANAAFTRHAYADTQGHWHWLSQLERSDPGLLQNWAPTLASWQRIECVAIVVRRSCYESLGGFRTDLSYVLDWEMWARIARHHPFVYSPRLLAAYRLHDSAESARLRNQGETLEDTLKGFNIILQGVDSSRIATVTGQFFQRYTARIEERAIALYAGNEPRKARLLLNQHWAKFPANRRSDVWFLRLRCLAKEWRRRCRIKTLTKMGHTLAP